MSSSSSATTVTQVVTVEAVPASFRPPDTAAELRAYGDQLDHEYKDLERELQGFYEG